MLTLSVTVTSPVIITL